MCDKRSNNPVSNVNYHFVWCPKYRNAIFDTIEESLQASFRGMCDEYGYEILSSRASPRGRYRDSTNSSWRSTYGAVDSGRNRTTWGRQAVFRLTRSRSISSARNTFNREYGLHPQSSPEALTLPPASARFIPANPDTVELLLEQLIAYLNRGAYPPLVDVAITHYQFETVHPFFDGNGRLGRLLMMLQLFDAGLLPEPYLYLSAYFNRHRQEYLDHLLAVSRDGAWEEWLVFVLNAVA